MKLEKLDLLEFFKKENGELYNGYGIGGVGVITPFQMVNVVNVDRFYRDTSRMEWGYGYHVTTREEVIKQIYGIEYSESESYSKDDKRCGLGIFKLINIKYVNCCAFSFIEIMIPAFIDEFQYSCLIDLFREFEKLGDLLENVELNIKNTGVDVSNYPNRLNEEWNFKKMEDALEYYKNHIREIDLSIFPNKENILNLQCKKRGK